MLKLDVNFFNPFIQGTLKTLQIQCQIEANTAKPFIKGTQQQPEFDIAGILGITSKTFNGSLSLLFPETVFIKAMSGMMGEEYTEITKDLQDGAAELLNIIFGTAKTVLNDQGYRIDKAIPSFIRGRDIKASTLAKSSVLVIPFLTQHGEFHLEICAE